MRKWKFCTGFFALWILCADPLSGQSSGISFEHFTHEHGISGPVTRIAQDSLGFLWLGSMDGLYRFDGENFVQYRNNPADKSTLPNNIINDVCVDAQNRIWAATNGGLCYFDFSDGLFHQVAFDIDLETIDRHRSHAIWPAHEEGVWFASKTILHHWKKDTILSHRLPYFENLTIKCLYQDHKQHVWIGTNFGLFLFDPESNRFTRKEVVTDFSRKLGLLPTIHPIVPLHGDTLLIGSWYGGVQKVIYEDGEIHCFPLEDPVETNPRKHVIKGLAAGRTGQWWVGSYGSGLSIWDNVQGTFTRHFHHDDGDPKSLGSDYILDLYSDRSGILWIATDRGLDKFDPLARQFLSIPLPELSSEFSVYQLPGFIKEDLADEKYLWICVSGAGMFHFNTIDRSFELYQHDPKDPSSLPDNSVYVLYYDRQGKIWVGTRAGMAMFDPVLRKFYPVPIAGLAQIEGAHTILQDDKDNFWFATHSHGVYCYVSEKDTIIHYQHIPQGSNVLPDNRVFCMIQDKQGDFWFGTQNRGMCKLDLETNTFSYFQNDKTDPASLPDNGVYELYEDPDGTFWVTTENGFALMDRARGTFHTYTTFDGLCNNTVYSILPDDQGNLWLGTNGGLSRFDPVEKQFKNYYVHDGLPSNSISGAMLMKDGSLYFGTTGMINYCQPRMMKMNRRLPPVIITQFKIFDKEYPVHRIRDMIDPIHLSHHENMITFDFAALNYTHSSLNQYAYKLEGFDEQWIYCGHKQSATYTNLNGGTYTFRVKAANNDGMWNEAGTYVTLIVHPPYWRTWWFFTLLALLALSLLYIAYRIRVRQLMQLQNIRLRISRDLHDDIGSTLSSINMISSMSAQATKNGEKSTEKFQVIANASRQAMELMSDIVWSIHPKHDKMEMMIIRMRQYTSEILEAAQISFTIDLDENAKKVILPIEKRKDFYLIYKEAINNLAKHSRAKHAAIRIAFQREALELTITDDGVGFDPEYNYTGNGVKNMKARAMQIDASLNLSSVAGKGTTMIMQIPVI